MTTRPGARTPLLHVVVLAALVGTTGVLGSAPASAATGKAHRAPHPTVIGQPAPKGTARLLAVSCGSARDCWAVGSGDPGPSTEEGGSPATIVATTDGGTHWSTQTVPTTGASTLSSISCPDSRHCLAVGDQSGTQLVGIVVSTANGGRLWQSLPAPAGAANLVGIHCSTPSLCLALATDGATFWSATTTDGGATWVRGGNLPAGFAGAVGVACPDVGVCLVAGYVATGPGHGAGAVAVSTDDGTTWTTAAVPSGTGLLHGIVCPNDTTCIVVGTTSTTDTDIAPGKGVVLASVGGLTTFSALRAPASVNDGFAVDCPTVSSCAAVGTTWTGPTPSTPTAGIATTPDGGVSWRDPTTRFVPLGLADVDCPTATSCVAVGGNVLARLALPTAHRNRS